MDPERFFNAGSAGLRKQSNGFIARRITRNENDSRRQFRPVSLEPVVEAFVKYIVSRDGQAETIKSGLYPLIPSTRLYDLHRLGISTETQ